MNNWDCPVCGFEADNSEEGNDHLYHMGDDAHRELVKEKTKNTTHDLQDNIEDTWDDVKH